MATKTRLQVIDADSHVMETERTWDYLEPSEQKYRPLLYSSPEDPINEYWMNGGKIGGFRFPTLAEQTVNEMSQRSGRGMETPQQARELDDVELRLKHMDELGIDIQVLHTTIGLTRITDWPDIEAALCRSYNRWLGDVWRKAKGRLRWSCLVPTMMLDEAVLQMRSAKENGAVAVCLRPLEGNRVITDRYFYPIFEEASRLDMAIALHTANGNPENLDLWRTGPGPEGIFGASVQMFRIPTVAVCYTLIMGEIPHVFPKLRWGFIEASAQWIPWIYHEAAHRSKQAGRKFPDDVFTEYKVYVTCQNDDDLPWVLKYSGENSLVIGTDYGHTDASSDTDAIVEFREREDISPGTKDRVLHYNPKALYAL